MAKMIYDSDFARLTHNTHITGLRVDAFGIWPRDEDYTPEDLNQLTGEERAALLERPDGWEPGTPYVRFPCSLEQLYSGLGLDADAIDPEIAKLYEETLLLPAVISDADEPLPSQPIDGADTPLFSTEDVNLSALFDPVSINALAKMFPTPKNSVTAWKNFSAKSSRYPELRFAKKGHALYNPWLAGLWWLSYTKPDGWDLARLKRAMAKQLPARSQHMKHLFEEEFSY